MSRRPTNYLKNLTLTVVLILLLSSVVIFAIHAARRITAVHPQDAPQDFSMSNLTYTKFNQHGEIAHQVQAKNLAHLTKKNTFLFSFPRILIRDRQQADWRISAQRGKSENGKETIDFWQGVKIERAKHREQLALQIKTDAVRYHTLKKLAETQELVKVIENQENFITGRGVYVDFKAGIVKILSKIQAIYQIT